MIPEGHMSTNQQKIATLTIFLAFFTSTTLGAEDRNDAQIASEVTEDANRSAMLTVSNRAAQLFAEGRYEEAARDFRHAFELSPEPDLLKNVMVAWFKTGNCGKARPAGDAFLATGSHSITEADRGDVESVRFQCFLQDAEIALAKNQLDAADQSLREAAHLARNADRRSQMTGVQTRIDQARHSTDGSRNARAQNDGEGAANWTVISGWTLTAAGSLTLALMSWRQVDLNAELEDLTQTIDCVGEASTPVEEAKCGYDETNYRRLEDRVDDYGKTAAIFWGLGGLSLATGIALLIVDGHDEGEISSFHLQIVPTLGSLEAVFNWTF
jgi:tetratricopeptide (TPR) repeat protein